MPAITIPRPGASEYAPFYAGYVAGVPDGDLIALLEQQGQETNALLGAISEEKSDHRYAPGKWTIREVLGHIVDGERVFSYRALTFARGDAGPLPSFDENAWAAASNAGRRAMKELLAEYRAVRAATVALFRSFGEEEFARSGIASKNPVTVRALAYIIAGHERHHLRILRERYLA
jgi:uncharacterized damage-inducible protein DinB